MASFTTEDRLRRGKPRPPLGSQSKAFKEEESSLDSVLPIDPKRISRCCIKSGLFPTMSIHLELSYGEATG
ncbi:zinc finger MYM-type protein 1-like [Pyrus ussuriensis x Pyrus communis]|uniref:Zinc finger MYM-type protein 1-like n=1 Tax=Pyrus ussuriensis x Pyrus communis TaxID=2448454 RepID=A0A5N5FIY8_9ROSA|nr:zinc finger MYM-type protein 1-like [Pyrus ussuriensis x Pyrus communis]